MTAAGILEAMKARTLEKCMEKCTRGGCLGNYGRCTWVCYCYGVGIMPAVFSAQTSYSFMTLNI